MHPGNSLPRLRFPLLGAVLYLLACSCSQHPDVKPVVRNVLPRALGQGERRYLLVDGRDFEPALSWSAQSGEASVDDSIAVAIDDGPFFTEDVHLLHPGRLSVLPPADLQLDPGWHALAVRLPNGNQHRLDRAFYVDDQGYDALLAPCFNDANGNYLIDHSDLALCELQRQPDGQYLQVLFLQDLVTSFGDGSNSLRAGGWQRGFAFSPLGTWLAFLRFVPGDPPRLRLVLRHLPSSQEQVLDELQLPPPPAGQDDYYSVNNVLWEGPLRSTFSTPAFSPDESLLAYVRRGNQVMLAQLGTSPEQVLPPFLLSQPPPWQGEVNLLFYPNIDAGNRFVLVTEVDVEIDSEGQVQYPAMKPLLIGIGDGTLRRLASEDSYFDGAATFLPSGAEVLFASDRLDLTILTPLGLVAPAIGLFRVGLFGGPLEKVPAHSAVFLFGPLEVAPDGSLAAAAGFLTTSASGIDVVATGLANGWQGIAGKDQVGICYPADTDSDCRDLGYDSGDSLLCCMINSDGGTDCCSEATPWACPTWDMLPVFSGFSQMASFALAVNWMCMPVDPTDQESRHEFMGYPEDLFLTLYRSDGNELVDGVVLVTGQNWLPFVPAFHRRVNLPEGSDE